MELGRSRTCSFAAPTAFEARGAMSASEAEGAMVGSHGTIALETWDLQGGGACFSIPPSVCRDGVEHRSLWIARRWKTPDIYARSGRAKAEGEAYPLSSRKG